MGIPANIDDLINQRIAESNRIEFESGFNPNPIEHAICGFANYIDNIGGGCIIIGVEEENGSPVPQWQDSLEPSTTLCAYLPNPKIEAASASDASFAHFSWSK